jgi:general secretion pathway protein N
MRDRRKWGRNFNSAALIAAAMIALAAEAAPQGAIAQTQAALDMNVLPTSPGAVSPESNLTGGVPVLANPSVDIAARQPLRAAIRELRGNPLWAVPLRALTATRERPILVPSRRAPAPVVAGAPPPPPPAPPPLPVAPERPQLALVGAVAGEEQGIALLLDRTTRDIIRLRIGEDVSGWVLRSVRGREAALQKDEEIFHLALPGPNDAVEGPALPPVPGLPGLPAMSAAPPPQRTAQPVPALPGSPPIGVSADQASPGRHISRRERRNKGR